MFGWACDLLSSPGGSVDEHLSGQPLQPPVDERPLGQTLDLLLMSSEHPSGLAVQQPAVDERPSGQALQPPVDEHPSGQTLDLTVDEQ